MMRLHPRPNKRFRDGAVREDGFIFDAYKPSIIKKDGFFAENWRSPIVFKKAADYSTRRKKAITQYITDYVNKYKLERGCFVCNYKKDACALDAHHTDPKKKKFNIGTNRKNSYIQFEAIKKELKKCLILCANCHREITRKNREKSTS